jgi:tetratricopeptide (TPR) repeat protein
MHNNNDNESSVEIEVLEISNEDAAREQAMALRSQGKELHDRGEYQEAADIFQQASRLLLEYTISNKDNTVNDPRYLEVAEEYATCRLHEALCRLKDEDYEKCIEACSDVLNEPAPAVLLQETDGTEETPPSSPSNRTRLAAPISGAAKARAFHRRAKAKLGLGDTEGALADARSAAFLGDRKAVALYGRLLRSQDPSAGIAGGMDANPFWLSQSQDSSSSSLGSSMSSSLFESFLGKSTTPSIDPMGGLLTDFMSSNFLSNNNKNGNSAGSLAQSVIKSLSKRLDDASTQDLICNYLQSANANQVQQMASLAGFQVSPQQASQLVNFCHTVTPKGISKTVRTTRRVVYGVSLVRKSMKVLRKYNSVLVLVAVMAWIKSAILRPIPINKKLAKEALNAALRQSRK